MNAPTPVCTRIYIPDQRSQYKNQLNNWCDRVHIPHIRFNTNLTAYRDEQNHLLYEAVPIFPGIIDLRQFGRTGIQYNQAASFELRDRDVIGWGTSVKVAEEMAATRLLESRRYCLYY